MGWKDAPIVDAKPSWMKAPREGVIDTGYGTPLVPESQNPLPIGASGQPAVEKSLGESLIPPALEGGGAVLGGMAGGAMGGRLTGPSGVFPGAVRGEMAGAAIGQMGSQALGYSPPSVMNIEGAALAPAAGRLLGGALRAGATKLPGAATVMNESAIASLRPLAADLLPGTPSKDLYTMVKQFDPKIKTDNLRQAIGTLTDEHATLAKGLKNTQSSTIAEGLREKATGTVDYSNAPYRIPEHMKAPLTNEMSFTEYWNNLSKLGHRVEAARLPTSATHAEYGDLKFMYAAMRKDLEAAAAGGNEALPAVQALRAANHAARREFASTELSDFIEGSVTNKNVGSNISGTGLVSKIAGIAETGNKGVVEEISGAKLLKLINADKNKLFRDSLSTDELTAIRNVANELGKVPAINPRLGVKYGSGMLLGGISAAGGAGYLAGGEGASKSSASTVAIAGPVIAAAMMTPTGRAALLAMHSRGANLFDNRVLAIISAATHGAFTQ